MTAYEIIVAHGCWDDSPIFAEPEYNDAIIGVTLEGNIVYDFDKMVQIIANRDHITQDEAADDVFYNMDGSLSFAGELHPIIIFNYLGEEDL